MLGSCGGSLESQNHPRTSATACYRRNGGQHLEPPPLVERDHVIAALQGERAHVVEARMVDDGRHEDIAQTSPPVIRTNDHVEQHREVDAVRHDAREANEVTRRRFHDADDHRRSRQHPLHARYVALLRPPLVSVEQGQVLDLPLGQRRHDLEPGRNDHVRRRWFAIRLQIQASYVFCNDGSPPAFARFPCIHNGEGGIRTHGRLAPSTVFKTVTFDRSVTSPSIAYCKAYGRVHVVSEVFCS